MEDAKNLQVGLQSLKDGIRDQCNFYLKKKNRFCRFKPKFGQKYCPEHACILGVQTERKRIPCPLNPKHNCYEDELEKHKRKCNVTKIQQKVEQAVYYVKGVNKGENVIQERLSVKNQVSVKDLTSTDLAKMIQKVNDIYQAHVERVTSSYFQHPCVQDQVCSSKDEDMSCVLKDQAALRKELLQQAGLVGQMEKEKFLGYENSCFVELGAGKGKLSHWIRKATMENSKNKFLLVERGSVRYKVDGHQKQNDGETNFKRIKMDIEDLFLGKVPELDNVSTVIVVGKHLCGGATDMGIRCAVNTLGSDEPQKCSEVQQDIVQEYSPHKLLIHGTSNSNVCPNSVNVSSVGPVDFNSGPSEKESDKQKEGDLKCFVTDLKQNRIQSTGSEGKTGPLRDDSPQEPPIKQQKVEEASGKPSTTSRLPKGIMIALCCHHQCTWDTYVGKSFMEKCGVGPEEFDLLTRLSSWATCARVRVTSNKKLNTSSQAASNPQKLCPTKTSEESSTTGNAEEAYEEHCTKDLISLTKNCSQSLREQLSVSERERIGRQCKRIIDTGRLHFLRSLGMKALLREYIDEHTTPENVVLVACS